MYGQYLGAIDILIVCCLHDGCWQKHQDRQRLSLNSCRVNLKQPGQTKQKWAQCKKALDTRKGFGSSQGLVIVLRLGKKTGQNVLFLLSNLPDIDPFDIDELRSP